MKLNVSPTVIRTLVEEQGYFRTTAQAFQYWKDHTNQNLESLDKEQIKALFNESDYATRSIQDYLEDKTGVRLTATNIKGMFASKALQGVRRKAEYTGNKGPKKQEIEIVFDDSSSIGLANENGSFNESDDNNDVIELEVEEETAIPNFGE